jgi:hypothetical protein
VKTADIRPFSPVIYAVEISRSDSEQSVFSICMEDRHALRRSAAIQLQNAAGMKSMVIRLNLSLPPRIFVFWLIAMANIRNSDA